VTLQQLRYFLATCRHGSFTAAAEALFIAQPSVAEQIRRLEQEVGVRLFVRTGRRLELTEAGSNLITHAERVIAAMDAAEASMLSARELRGGTASLGTFGIAQRYLVNEIITTFVARYPEVNVRVVGVHSSEVIEQVRNGELEAGLVTLPVDEPSLVVEPVMSDEVLFTALAGPDTERPMTIKRLAELRMIHWPGVLGWRDSIRRQLKGWADEERVELEASIEVEHMTSALDLAGQGLGSTFVLRTIAESTWFPHGLKAVSFARPLYDTYAFVWRRDHTPSPASAELMRLARQKMASYEQRERLRIAKPTASTGRLPQR
jgi:DNA-binding transcriptional LysR family regulator